MAGPPRKNATSPFVTQPQGGAPPRPVVGTENAPYVHPFPGQPVDPRNFVGPGRVLDARPGVAGIGAAAAAPAPAPAASASASASASAAGAVAYAPQPASALAVNQMPGAAGHPSFGYTRLDSYFLSRLPAAGLTFWHRKHVVAGTTAIPAINTIFTLPVYQLEQGLSLIILSFTQNWYDASLDPLDPDALTAFQSDQAVYGRVGVNLIVNNAPVFDANEILFDPNGGVPTARQQSGFTALNQNLLFVGEHPTAVFVRDHATVQVRYTVSNTLPGHIPTAVGVEMRGYVMPTKAFNELLISVRNQW